LRSKDGRTLGCCESPSDSLRFTVSHNLGYFPKAATLCAVRKTAQPLRVVLTEVCLTYDSPTWNTGASDFVNALTVAADLLQKRIKESAVLEKDNVAKRIILVTNFLDAVSHTSHACLTGVMNPALARWLGVESSPGIHSGA